MASQPPPSNGDHVATSDLWEEKNIVAEIVDANRNDESKRNESITNVTMEPSHDSEISASPNVISPSERLDASSATEEQSDLTSPKRKAEDASFSATITAIVQEATHGLLEPSPEPPLGTPPKKRARRSVPARISWDERIASLKAYKEEHGDLNIPIRYKQNPSLGKFVHNTREQYKLFHHQCKPGYQKRCCLTEERIAMLNEIGFIWTTERVQKQNDDWAHRLEQLKEYKAQHGHCLVPHGYDVDPSFAEWIHRQRTTYISMLKEEKPSPLVQSRMEKLEEIGFNFTVHSDKWMDHWNMLKQYKEKHGDCQVPTHYAENPKLGRWTHTQRHQRRLQLKGKKSCITEERIALLDQLGFSWEVRPAMEQPRATWQQRYDELREFHEEHGHFLIPSDLYPKLHRWCLEQRSRLQCVVDPSTGTTGEGTVESPSTRRMGSDRIKALEDIGFTKDAVLSESHASVAPSTVEESTQPAVKLEEADVVAQEVIALASIDNTGVAAI